jgi:hypothetical protein
MGREDGYNLTAFGNYRETQATNDVHDVRLISNEDDSIDLTGPLFIFVVLTVIFMILSIVFYFQARSARDEDVKGG